MKTTYALQFANLNSFYIITLILALVLSTYLFLKFKGASFSWRVFVFRFLALLMLALALLEPKVMKKTSRTDGLLLLDISDSMEPEVAQNLLNKAAEYKKEGFEYRVIPFSGQSCPYSLPSEKALNFDKLRDSWNRLNIGVTDLEEALRSQLIDPNTGVLLISDGYETVGDLSNTFPDLQGEGVKVFPLMPNTGGALDGKFRISHIHAPLMAPLKKSVPIRVSVENSTTQDRVGQLLIFHDEKEVYNKEIVVPKGQEAVFVAYSDPLPEGIKGVKAILKPLSVKPLSVSEDDSFDPTSAQLFIAAEEKEKVLLVSSSAAEARLLERILKEQSYHLQSVVTAGNRLADRLELSKYSVVIFNNVPLAELPRGVATEVEYYVANGGGFIMIGGNKSFGLGGYKDTAIADLLPVEVLTPRKEQKRLNVAVELVLDKSASMRQNNKIEFVKSAAAEVLKVLKPQDYAGIVGFDDYPFHLVPIGRIQDIRAKALARLSQLYPAKTTRLLAAMVLAKKDLESVPAGRKHMIILTDGKLPDQQNYPYYMEIVDELRLLGVTVSTFLIGNEYVPILVEIAERGGGAFYRTDNPTNLPRLFLHDVKVNAGEKTQRENQRYDVDVLMRNRSTTLNSFPYLLGYVETKIKPSADLELATATKERDPLLASWRYKQGRAVAFTSDASGRWSKQWAEWGKFRTFWIELIDSVRPQSGKALENIKYDLRYFMSKGKLVLDLTVYSEGVVGDLTADLIASDGVRKNVTFTPLARGHYQAQLDGVTAGRYELQAKLGGIKLTAVAFQLSGEVFGEKKGQGFFKQNLEALAAATKGKVNPAVADLMDSRSETVEDLPLNHWLCALALFMLCIEIVLRELFSRRSYF